MPTKNTKEVASHLAIVQHVWKERGISFPKKDDPMKASFYFSPFSFTTQCR